MTKVLYKTVAFWLVLFSLIAGGLLDLVIPLGVAAAVIYVIPVLLSYNTPSQKFTYFVLFLSVILTVIGYLLSPSGGEPWKVISNRALSIMAIISVGISVILIKKHKQALLKQTEIAIAAEHQAKQANIAKSNFLSSMSHELRTPLNSIIGFSELLKSDENLDEDQIESIKFINQSGISLLGLITMTLEFSNLQDQLICHDTSFRLDTSVINIINKNKSLAKDLDIQIDSQKIMLFPIKTIQSDPNVIQQIIDILLKNAIQYNTPGGSIIINSILTDHGKLRINITDTGSGIAPDKIDEIFQPFSRLGMENSIHAGMGLGLAKAKLLTEAIHGNIGFYNNNDTGCTFWLDIAYLGPEK